MTRLRIWIAMMCGLSIAIASASPSAAVMIFTGNITTDENVVYNGAGVVIGGGLTVTGRGTDTDNLTDVMHKGPLPVPGFELKAIPGAAKVEGTDGTDQVLYGDVEITRNPANPVGFTAMEFNVFADVASLTGDDGLLRLIIKGNFPDFESTVDKFGVSLTLGNATNRFGIEVDPGELIQSVQITARDSTGQATVEIIQDIRQLRVNGNATPTAVPEPSAGIAAAIGFFAFFGLGTLRRRHARA